MNMLKIVQIRKIQNFVLRRTCGCVVGWQDGVPGLCWHLAADEDLNHPGQFELFVFHGNQNQPGRASLERILGLFSKAGHGQKYFPGKCLTVYLV